MSDLHDGCLEHAAFLQFASRHRREWLANDTAIEYHENSVHELIGEDVGSDMNLDTFAARQQGAEGFQSANNIPSTRTTEGNIFGIVLLRKLTKSETVTGRV